MNLYSYIRGLFGFPEYKKDNQPQRQDDKPCGSMLDEFHGPIWNWDENSDYRTCPPHRSFGYDIFSNPVEIHRHFEQEMETMSRFFETFENIFGGGSFQSHPPVSDQDQHQGKQDLRDRYVKPKYWNDSHESEWIPGHARRKKQLDDDLDDRVSAGELDQILKDKPSMEKYEPHIQIRTFGKSSFNKIVTNSDGTVEHHRTVRDGQGNEEITVTQQIGDKRYSVTTHIDSRGEKQQIENFVNIEKGDLDIFKKEWARLRQTPQFPATDKEPKPDHLSIFDQFFK